ncbi:hypothetical protein ID866_6529 [Astraeus odoratus]|nr:hypothetical protein ID866_6529 [Astraeus odoratus]
MTKSSTAQTRTRQAGESGSGKRGVRGARGGRGGRGGRGRGGSRASHDQHQDKPEETITPEKAATSDSLTSTVPGADVEANQNVPSLEATICWICAEPVKYYSVCETAAPVHSADFDLLKQDPQPVVIFTTSADTLFASYKPDDIPHKDPKLSIYFETQDMMEETLVLLRFNCPDRDCDYTASGWGDLKLHTRGTHGKVMCDLCLRSKKVFAHEHTLYPPNVLPLHLPSMSHRSHNQSLKEPIEGGVHPLCEFCRECFFSDDELFVHMRERHEECFICKRDGMRDQYFQNYASLETHFSQAHFACMNPTCQAQKFVVFGTELDFKAHQVEVHGTEMSSRDKRDARRVQAEFTFDDAGGGSRRHRTPREREPPPEPSGPPLRPTGSRREAFGGRLTSESSAVNGTMPQSLTPTLSTPSEDVDPVVSERHMSFLNRLQTIAPNPTNALPAIRATLRGYRSNELSARDVISTVWNVLDNNLDDTATIINGIVDLLDEEGKKADLLASWNGFKIETPELVPTSVGAAYAGVASGRIINAKKATTRSSRQTSRQVLDRVAQAASSSAPRPVPGSLSWGRSSTPAGRFPPLPGPSVSTASGARQHQSAQRTTTWTPAPAGGLSSNSTHPNTTDSKVSTGQRKPPPPLSSSAFPELPSATNMRMKPRVAGNQSLRNILGDSLPSSSAWKTDDGRSEPGDATVDPLTRAPSVPVTGEGSGGGKGKKGKGKQKQMLFTLGSFPS